MIENENTNVFIPVNSIGTVVIDGGGDSGVVIIGSEEFSVVIDDSDLVASESTEPLNVIVAENPVTVILSTPALIVTSDGIPGPVGPPGSAGGNAGDITYGDSTVQAALDAILYVAPQVTLSNNVGTVEVGSTVNNVALSWSVNKTMTSLSLDHGVGDVLGLTSKSLTGLGLTSGFTWTIAASDGTNTAHASTSISFANKRYWGASPSETLDNAAILELSSEFASGFGKSITYNASGGKYLYYAFPVSFGVPEHVTVGGLAFSDFTVTTQNFTNASGHTEVFNVIRLNNRQTGGAIAVVWG